MRAKLSWLADREVGFLLITGQKKYLSARKVWAIFFGLDSAIFLGPAFGLVTFLFPVASEVYIPWWMKLAGFAMFFAMIPILYFGQVLVLALISARLPRIYVFEPLLLLMTAFIIEVFDHKVSPILFGEAWIRWLQTVSFGEQVAGTFILMVALDIMFCYFVLPRLEQQAQAMGVGASEVGEDAQFEADNDAVADPAGDLMASSESDAAAADARQIPSNVVEIDGYKAAKVAILAVEAEEHYVRVWTEDREIYARHSFGRLVAQMNDSEGFIPRRGVWFNYRNIQSIRRDENGKYVIGGVKGPTVIVPKAKAREIKGLLKKRPFLPVRQGPVLRSDPPAVIVSGEASKA